MRNQATAGNEGTAGALTTEDMRKHLQCSRKTIYRLVESGDIPAYRLGNPETGPIRCEPEDFERFIERRKNGTVLRDGQDGAKNAQGVLF